jgi:hypothetical protein
MLGEHPAIVAILAIVVIAAICWDILINPEVYGKSKHK